ncbi:hypothetical protein B0A55_12092 [Friedmanniomyces simplex]|uniref:Uncharacterized protein n=1 Tax=Friedmanniomyces simplex TaxID=329884 RepID=A0A4U0VST1_9PEZI|nr:hypothetical protein B0A55_12092 [Friedmanniomyces simplex]
MHLADFEWLAALAYPVGILISALLAKKKPVPTVAPATISDLREQILANAGILYPASRQPNIPDLAIAILSEDNYLTEQLQPPSGGTSKTKGEAKKMAVSYRAALLLVRRDEEDDNNNALDDAQNNGATATTRTLAQGSPGKKLGEALEGLLAVTAAALEERIGYAQQRGRARKRE